MKHKSLCSKVYMHSYGAIAIKLLLHLPYLILYKDRTVQQNRDNLMCSHVMMIMKIARLCTVLLKVITALSPSHYCIHSPYNDIETVHQNRD